MLPAAGVAARPLRGRFQDGDWSRPAASGGNGSLIRILLRGVRSWLGIGELDRLGMCRYFLPHHPPTPSYLSFLHYYYFPCVFAASSTRSYHTRHARLSSPFSVTFSRLSNHQRFSHSFNSRPCFISPLVYYSHAFFTTHTRHDRYRNTDRLSYS